MLRSLMKQIEVRLDALGRKAFDDLESPIHPRSDEEERDRANQQGDQKRQEPELGPVQKHSDHQSSSRPEPSPRASLATARLSTLATSRREYRAASMSRSGSTESIRRREPQRVRQRNRSRKAMRTPANTPGSPTHGHAIDALAAGCAIAFIGILGIAAYWDRSIRVLHMFES